MTTKIMAKQNPDVQMLLALQDATVIADNRFTTSDGIPLRVRSIDYISDEFEINDIIKIPQNYQVLSVKINGLAGYRCIEVHVESEDGRVRKALFFPNCLAKTITPIDANGHRMEKVKTLGPVAEWYSKQGTIDHAMETLAGEELIVVDKEIYTIRDYETRKPCYTPIYNYAWRSNTRRITKDNIKNQILSMIDYLLNDRLPQEASKHLNDGDECIIHFKFTGYFGEETLFKQDYSINNIKVQLPMDFEKNMESWVSYIYKQRTSYTIDFEYKLDYYNKNGERKYSIIDNYVNGDAFDNGD